MRSSTQVAPEVKSAVFTSNDGANSTDTPHIYDGPRTSLVLKPHPPSHNHIASNDRMTWQQRVESMAGFVYVSWSIALSVLYMHLLFPSLANQLSWANYNTTTQLYLGELANFHLNVQAVSSIRLMASSSAFFRPMSHEPPMAITMSPVYPRMLVLQPTTNLEDVIKGLHANELNVGLPTHYCWVDFDQRFQMARTAARQARCATSYATNAAVHLEAVVRNVPWAQWEASFGGQNGSFTGAIVAGILEFPTGAQWLESVENAFEDVASEAAYWRSKQRTTWQLRWHNGWSTGVEESIAIVNAFGSRHDMTIKSMAFFPQATGSKSTVFNAVIASDMSFARLRNYSLVRGTSRSIPESMLLSNAGIKATMASQLWAITIGPYGAIDAIWVPLPPSLARAVMQFQSETMRHLQNRSLALAITNDNSSPQYANVIPKAWARYNFSGGNPMCEMADSSPVVHNTFGFDDMCLTWQPFTVGVTPFSAYFAILAMQQSEFQEPNPQRGVPFSNREYVAVGNTSYMDSVRDLFADAPPINLVDLDQVARDVANVSVFQFAVHRDTKKPSFLRQTLIDPADAPWAVYGFMLLYHWATQKREVIRFEGDVDSITLMSKEYDMLPYFPPRFDPSSDQTGTFLKFITIYVTASLALVAALMVVYGFATRFRALGRNLFRFNRVAGSVWIGRLFLVVRGATAVGLLGSPSVQMQSTCGMSRLISVAPSIFETFVVVGESTWIVYAIQDTLAAFVTEYSYYAGPVSATLAWLLVFLLQVVVPIQPTLELNRTCTTLVTSKQVVCSSGVLYFGSSMRVGAILCIQAGSILVVYVAAVARQWKHESPRVTLLMSVASEAFLDKTLDEDFQRFCFDRVTCIMSGVLTLHTAHSHYVFDIKSWSILHTPINDKTRHRRHSCSFEPPSFEEQSPRPPAKPASAFRPLDRLLAVGGLLYMVFSVAGSVLYITTTQADTTNDFWWSEFNATGAYGFLGNWFSTQLLLTPSGFNDTLDNLDFADVTPYNSTSTVISSSALYANIVQFEDASVLPTAIRGLRRMNVCNVPNIMTAYCWVDFKQRFPVAHSQKRQARCLRDYADNGAVYLESALRNVHTPIEPLDERCWTLNEAFGQELVGSALGLDLIDSLDSVTTTIDEEVRYWQSFAITAYVTQFQNFKKIGLVETFRIQNALGVQYTLSLKSSKEAFQIEIQSSMKLYWGLATDMNELRSADSPMYNRTLLRTSSRYAFANQTMETALYHSAVLLRPLGVTFTTLQRTLGPFGTIDAIHVPVPASLRTFYANITATLAHLVAASPFAQLAFYNLTVPNVWVPCPVDWLRISRYSGSLLCQDNTVASSRTLLSFWTHTGCNSAAELLTPTRKSTLIAIIASNTTNPTATCQSETRSSGRCVRVFTEANKLVQTFLAPDEMAAFEAMASDARLDMFALNVSMLQFRKPDGGVMVRNLFAPTAASFWFFSWGFALEWVAGTREVVSFEGANGRLVLLSSTAFPVEALPNPLEIPRLVSSYARNIVQYITGMLAVVAVLTSVHIVGSVGRVEGWNVLELNRVAAVVWTGRPMLFLRSMVAFCVLSTAQVRLAQFGPVGMMTAFETHELEWYKVILTSGEATWFVFVVCDVLIVVTKQHTAAYTAYCGMAVWVVGIVLSVYSPVAHSVVVNRVCTIDVVDFLLRCDAGLVVIGSYVRFSQLVVVSLVSVVVCFGYQRVRHRRLKDDRHQVSLLLASSARYLFSMDHWKYRNVYYLDKASAVITGLLCVEYDGVFYVFDVKLWRVFVVQVPPHLRVPNTHPMHDRVKCAFPLLGKGATM